MRGRRAATRHDPARSSRPRCGCRGGSGSSPASRSSPRVGTAGARRSCCSLLALVVRRVLHRVARARGLEHALPAVLAAHVGLPRRDGRDRDRCGSSATVVTWAFRWITRGRSRKTRAPAAWADVAPSTTTRRRRSRGPRTHAVAVLAERRFDRGAAGLGAARASRSRGGSSRRTRRRSRRSRSRCSWCIGERLRAAARAGARATATRRSAIAVGRSGTTAATRAKPTWPEYQRDHDDDGQAAAAGRALWEPSATTRSTATARPSRSSCCRTSRNGRIDSMEGIYFESSATTDVPLPDRERAREAPVEPGARLVYGTPRPPTSTLGVRAPADARRALLHGCRRRRRSRWPPTQPDLKLVATVPDLDGAGAEGLEDLRGRDQRRVTARHGPRHEPVVAQRARGQLLECWGQPWTDTGSADAEARTVGVRGRAVVHERGRARHGVDARSGPKSWKHVDIKRPRDTTQTRDRRRRRSPTSTKTVDTISFHCREIGKPVWCRTSYFPNWQVHRRDGSVPRRAEPHGRGPDEPRREAHVRAHRRRLARPDRHAASGIVGLGRARCSGRAPARYGATDDAPDDDPTSRRRARRRTTSPTPATPRPTDGRDADGPDERTPPEPDRARPS